MRAALFGLSCCVAALGACHKDSAAPAASTVDTDALWKLAPADAVVGVVVAPRALQQVEHAWQDVHAYLAAAPELAAIDRLLGEQLEKLTGNAHPTLADLGLAPAHGAALFVGRGGASVMIVPLGDRDKFLATMHGTRGADTDTLPHGLCKPAGELYACADSPEALAQLAPGGPASGSGADALRTALAAVGARGDIEAVALALPLQPSGPIDLAGVLQLERGAVTLRVAATGVAASTIAGLGAPAAVRAPDGSTAGFALVNLSKLVAQLPAVPVMQGVTLAELGRSVGDPLTVRVAAGRMDIDARLPLVDPAPLTQLVAHCADFGPLALAGATADASGCHLPLKPMGTTVDAWVEGAELRVGPRPAPAPSAAAPLTPLGRELAAGTWQLAFWGRGTLYAPLGTTLPGALPDQLKLMLRGVSVVSEVGGGVRAEGQTVRAVLGVRTLWANPDDVVARLAAVSPDDVVAGRATETAQRIAADAPSSPFAGDLAAGYGGLAVPAALTGMMSAIAIPAFEEYMRRSRPTQPMDQ